MNLDLLTPENPQTIETNINTWNRRGQVFSVSAVPQAGASAFYGFSAKYAEY